MSFRSFPRGDRTLTKVLLQDNRSESIGRLLVLWAYDPQVRVDFSRPGKVMDNSFVDTFDGSFRDDCLNVAWFGMLDEARAIVESWRRDCNEIRLNLGQNGLALGELTRPRKELNALQIGKGVEM